MSQQPDPSAATRSIEQEIVIDAPVERVWRALTDAEELTRWFPLEARVKPGPGGSIFMSWKNEWQFETPVAAWEENRRLRLVYYDGPDPVSAEGEPRHISVGIEYRLEAVDGGKTRLRLVQYGFGPESDWDELYDATRSGWKFQLTGLRDYLERHFGEPRAVAMARRQVKMPRDIAWRRLTAPGGMTRGGVRADVRAGDKLELELSGGPTLRGTVLTHIPPKELVMTVENLDGAYMRWQIDWMKPDAPVDIILTLATFGRAADADALLARQWSDALGAVQFADA